MCIPTMEVALDPAGLVRACLMTKLTRASRVAGNSEWHAAAGLEETAWFDRSRLPSLARRREEPLAAGLLGLRRGDRGPRLEALNRLTTFLDPRTPTVRKPEQAVLLEIVC